MVPEFDEAVFTIDKGSITGPVKTQFGYHLIKLEDRQEGGQSEYAEVRNEIEKALTYQKQSEAYTNKDNDLKSKYNNIVKFNS